jgi:hypothetical protein
MKRLFGTVFAAMMTAAPMQEECTAARIRMADDIAAMARDAAAESGRTVFSAQVMDAMRGVERSSDIVSSMRIPRVPATQTHYSPSATARPSRSCTSWP